MKLQISSRIAIFALMELATPPEHQLAVAEIGEKYGISSHHLAKVMQVLAPAWCAQCGAQRAVISSAAMHGAPRCSMWSSCSRIPARAICGAGR